MPWLLGFWVVTGNIGKRIISGGHITYVHGDLSLLLTKISSHTLIIQNNKQNYDYIKIIIYSRAIETVHLSYYNV